MKDKTYYDELDLFCKNINLFKKASPKRRYKYIKVLSESMIKLRENFCGVKSRKELNNMVCKTCTSNFHHLFDYLYCFENDFVSNYVTILYTIFSERILSVSSIFINSQIFQSIYNHLQDERICTFTSRIVCEALENEDFLSKFVSGGYYLTVVSLLRRVKSFFVVCSIFSIMHRTVIIFASKSDDAITIGNIPIFHLYRPLFDGFSELIKSPVEILDANSIDNRDFFFLVSLIRRVKKGSNLGLKKAILCDRVFFESVIRRVNSEYKIIGEGALKILDKLVSMLVSFGYDPYFKSMINYLTKNLIMFRKLSYKVAPKLWENITKLSNDTQMVKKERTRSKH